MQIICPSCQSPFTVPAGYTRFFDMPIRCTTCRHCFDLPQRAFRQTGSTAQPATVSFFAGTVSAQRNHHTIRCRKCRQTLLLAGKDRALHRLWLTCPACSQAFRHDPVRHLRWKYGVILALSVGISVAIGILLLDHTRLISLDQMAAWHWLGDTAMRVYDMVRYMLDQVRTAAMARLV